MKALSLLLVLPLLWSCTSGPIIRETGVLNDAGHVVTSTTIIAGGTFAAKRKGVVTRVKKLKNGWDIVHMVDSESSEGVPMAALMAYGMGVASGDAATVETAKQKTAQHSATQSTLKHGKTVDGQVALGSEAIKAGNPATLAPIKTP